MARDFYPFVEGGQEAAGEKGGGASDEVCTVHHPARIAVYDDASAAPRVVVVEPKAVRDYLDEITSTVNRLSHEQGGTIPFMVVREIVENFIHASFRAPTISILDAGSTLRFSDQGPGIREKALALEYGTSSATEEMKHYIRGVGSGLPYAQQYMVDKGGSLEIEDNIAGGTVVTISTLPTEGARSVAKARPEAAAPETPTQPAWPAPWTQQPSYPYPWAQQPMGSPQPQTAAPAYQQQAPVPTYPPQAAPLSTAFRVGAPATPPSLDARQVEAIAYLAEHGTAGPTELSQTCGFSAPTWSRSLSSLQEMGLAIKQGQKYRLTTMGTALA